MTLEDWLVKRNSSRNLFTTFAMYPPTYNAWAHLLLASLAKKTADVAPWFEGDFRVRIRSQNSGGRRSYVRLRVLCGFFIGQFFKYFEDFS